MARTQENSATYLLVGNFNESMKLKAFVGYLGLEDIKLSKNAILEDGTHRIFDTPSVKVQGEPDMYILDNTNKILILIENKVKVGTVLEPAQKSEDGYLAILKDYESDGYETHLVYLVPKDYLYTKTIEEIIANHKNVHLITWDVFFDNFDTDRDLLPIKKAIQSIEIDGIEIEYDFFNQAVDFSLISPTIKKNELIAEYYIGQLILDSIKYTENGRKSLLKYQSEKWERPRLKLWADALKCTELGDSPCIEIYMQDDSNYYMVGGFDYIRQRFYVFMYNKKTNKYTTEYCVSIQLPLGIIKSYYALKNKYCEQLHDFFETWQSQLKTLPSLK